MSHAVSWCFSNARAANRNTANCSKHNRQQPTENCPICTPGSRTICTGRYQWKHWPKRPECHCGASPDFTLMNGRHAKTGHREFACRCRTANACRLPEAEFEAHRRQMRFHRRRAYAAHLHQAFWRTALRTAPAFHIERCKPMTVLLPSRPHEAPDCALSDIQPTKSDEIDRPLRPGNGSVSIIRAQVQHIAWSAYMNATFERESHLPLQNDQCFLVGMLMPAMNLARAIVLNFDTSLFAKDLNDIFQQ